MNKKYLIIGGSVLALLGAGVGLYLFLKDKKEDKSEKSDYGMTEEEIKKQGGDFGSVDETEFSSKDKIVGSKELKFGARGRRVAILQALLNHYKGQKLKIDGVFGNDTRLALLTLGYVKCTVASTCEMPITDFNDLLKKTNNDSSFKNTYNPSVNSDMKAVYNKYSS